MSTYFGYPAFGQGTAFTYGAGSESTICSTQIPDEREPVGLGVLATTSLNVVGTATASTVLKVRQGIGTAGTLVYQGTTSTSATQAYITFTTIDQSGTFPVPAYSLTITPGTGNAVTVNSAVFDIQGLGE